MDQIMAMVIVATATYGIYRLFELIVRRRERLAIIEKISEGIDPAALMGQLDLPNKNEKKYYGSVGSWAIRIGLLLIGVGLGVTIAAVIDLLAVAPSSADERAFYEFRNTLSILYPACAAIFGGVGLVIAYFIERKEYRKEQDKPKELQQ
ncbi:hypothetical protein D0T84_17230 [Dysgonomonas sp. 521]|uniref:DUF6249 domain-containing protein n=1 Tax=Dysgonomonas sp. 521 TaxID=2302932 RepID=UPI0013D435B3|nr:DUF6249 domain-containing protein [Dysgonomonas sp. 521]NDV96641.1 hypothetical protein [Dysgonomonas sp. 521]